jgi:type II secretory pathway component PulF
MFASAGARLPLPTRIVIACRTLKAYWYVVAGIMVGLFFMIKRYYATANGKRRSTGFC